MSSRSVIIGVSFAVCGLCVTALLVQSRQLNKLRDEDQRLRFELKTLQTEEALRASQSSDAKPVTGRSTSFPSLELLRLRNQVSMLTRRQRELADVPAENERLRNRLASAATNAATEPMPGYLRKSEACNVGYSSAENTIQTMLWAIQNQDLTNLLACYTPEIAWEIRKQAGRSENERESYLSGMRLLPGMQIVSRRDEGPDVAELRVRAALGEKPHPFRFRRINGEWKIDSR